MEAYSSFYNFGQNYDDLFEKNRVVCLIDQSKKVRNENTVDVSFFVATFTWFN